jgi:ADP-dependent NAD(P)H-hydrate dehydratase / NAD(P)H-hydrate epimerase
MPFPANDPAQWLPLLPKLDSQAHKYSRGHCAVWSGCALRTGASRLAAMAALRAGAGLVTLAGERDALLVQAAHVTAIMLREAADVAELETFLDDTRVSAFVIGPAAGVDKRTADCVVAACGKHKNTVVDADGLTVFAGEAGALCAAVKANKAATVLTPHEGEFARLFPGLEGSREERALAAARLTGAITVLKGARTVIAHPGGRCVVNGNAPPDLATAGSGDVLAGIIGGLLAQGMEPFAAASASVYLHGVAGQLAGAHLIAEDLPPLLPAAFRSLYDGA